MNDPTHLPHLLRLLDDPDVLTRQTLSRELSAYGTELEGLLDRLPAPPTAPQRRLIQALLREYADGWLRAHWDEWRTPSDDKARLEAGLEMISFYLGNLQRPRGELTRRLDAIASDYRQAHPEPIVFSLAEYLGAELGLTGVVHHYHAAAHSDLVGVLDARRGLPISLSCLFILLADRLNLPVEGCNNPGHFLAVARHADDVFLVDGFHGWQFFKVNAFLNPQDPVAGPVLHLIERGAPASAILTRTLMNLKRSFEIEEESARVRLMEELRVGMPEA